MYHPRFGILILNMNGARWLPGLLDGLRTDGYQNKRVYLVDNGSTDGSQLLAREQYSEVTILQMPRNMGYCMSYNVAVEAAFADGCEWVIWQNNDTLVLPGWLDSMAAAAAADSRIGVMGPVFRDWSSDGPNYFMQKRHPEIVSFMEDGGHAPVDVDWVEGSVCAVKRECLENVGPLEPSLFIYWEETDFCRRARFRGWRVVLVPGSVARHYGGGDTASGAIPAVNFNALKTRNYYVYTLCDPERSLLANLFNTARLYLVHMKAALGSRRPAAGMWQNTKVFCWFLQGIPGWIAKHRRDRRGGSPPKFCSGQEVSLKDLYPKESPCPQKV